MLDHPRIAWQKNHTRKGGMLIINLSIQKGVSQEPHRVKKRLGTTTFHVAVYSKANAKETAQDKITRLIRAESLQMRAGKKLENMI